MEKNYIPQVMGRWEGFRFRLVVEGVGVGLIAGLVVTAYRFLLEEADVFRGGIFEYLKSGHPALIALWFGTLALMGIIVGIIVKREPVISGSGIPQVKGVLLRQIRINWLKVIVGKFIGGTLAIGAGLSLGREGPSIQLGAAAGQGFSRILKRFKIEEKYLITCGAAAGLAAAFNAPLAGVIFVLEEIHKNFSPLILTSAMAASLTADFLSKTCFGMKPVFNLPVANMLPLHYYPYLVVLGLVIGVFGFVFNWSLVKTQDLYKKQRWLPREMRPVVPILIGGVLGFFLPQVLGGGHGLISSISAGSFTLGMLFLLIVVKFLFTMLSYGSGAPGGIFLPLLAIGALFGGIFGNLLVNVFNIDPQYINNFIILGMTGYFTAIVKAPITGSILITEMTGSFNHLLALTVVSITAYVVTDILKSKPIYELLLEKVLSDRGKSAFSGSERDKVIIEVAISVGCMFDSKCVKDIAWPKNCLLVGLKRGENEIIPKGSTRMFSGDYLIVLTGEDTAPVVKNTLLAMAEECSCARFNKKHD